MLFISPKELHVCVSLLSTVLLFVFVASLYCFNSIWSFYFVVSGHLIILCYLHVQFFFFRYSNEQKTNEKKTEWFFLFIIATNFNETSNLDTHRKWLFSLVIVKIPLLVTKSHVFLKRKFSKIPRNRKFLRIFFFFLNYDFSWKLRKLWQW